MPVTLPSLEKLEIWLSARIAKRERSEVILYLSVMIYAIVFSSLTILRYYSFKTGAWDLGVFTQSLWTTLNAGKFLYHTCELFINPSGSFFGIHFSPILFLILPFYRIFSGAETLLVLQSLALGFTAVPIYKLAKENSGGRTGGLVFAVAYLTFPALHTVNWYDFHVQAFMPLFFACAIYYMTKEKWSRYFTFITLALMCEEHAALTTFLIGLYITWRFRSTIVSVIKQQRPVDKKIFVPLATMVTSAIWYWFTLWQRNTFFPTNPATMEEFLGSPNFTILGAKNPLEIPLLVILKPLNAIQALEYDGYMKLLYLLLLFGPLAFSSFKALSSLIPTISWFGFSLLSQTMAHHMLGHHYETYVIPFIFAAAILGLRKSFLKFGLKGIRGSLKKIVVFDIIFLIAASPLTSVNFLFPRYTSIYFGEHERSLNEIIGMVPANASILTQNNIFPQVSYRVNAYVLPTIHLNTTIRDIVIDFANQTVDKVEYVLVDTRTDPIAMSLAISLLETRPQFKLIASGDNGTILLYHREP